MRPSLVAPSPPPSLPPSLPPHNAITRRSQYFGYSLRHSSWILPPESAFFKEISLDDVLGAASSLIKSATDKKSGAIEDEFDFRAIEAVLQSRFVASKPKLDISTITDENQPTRCSEFGDYDLGLLGPHGSRAFACAGVEARTV